MLLPTTSDVAALLRSYTVPSVAYGETPYTDDGDFNEHTKPTASQVGELITRASRLVYAETGSNSESVMPDELLRGAVKDVIALAAAAEIIRAYTPERITNAESVHASMRNQYNEELRSVTRAIAEAQETGAPQAGEGMLPSSACGVDFGDLPAY